MDVLVVGRYMGVRVYNGMGDSFDGIWVQRLQKQDLIHGYGSTRYLVQEKNYIGGKILKNIDRYI